MSDWYPGGADWDETKGELVAVVCPNCHSSIRKGDVCCRKCNKLLVKMKEEKNENS